mmetsp:Transcript_18040/g.54362  ORF Transcript_18040/g.54362 Transcript_18040/m.54362 type:complete len:148 (-) Transcript_18040:54-497(-)
MSSSTLCRLILLCLAGNAVAVRRMAFRRHRAGKWWPFSLASGTPAPPAAPKPVLPKLKDAKAQVLRSAAFVRKVDELCQGASSGELQTCQELAGERLFCSLLQRHGGEFRGMAGAAEARAKCKETDIMETTLEAAQDAQLQEEAEHS